MSWESMQGICVRRNKCLSRGQLVGGRQQETNHARAGYDASRRVGRGDEPLCLCRLSSYAKKARVCHEFESGRLSGSMTSDPKRGRARIVHVPSLSSSTEDNAFLHASSGNTRLQPTLSREGGLRRQIVFPLLHRHSKRKHV
jgi:hypothetical protein